MTVNLTSNSHFVYSIIPQDHNHEHGDAELVPVDAAGRHRPRDGRQRGGRHTDQVVVLITSF